MGDPDPRVAANLRKRRGVAKASVTRLIARVANLEGDSEVPNVGNAARQLLTRLQDASTAFQQAHMSLVDTIDGDEDLATEQAALDEFLDTVEDLATRLQTLIDSADKPKQVDERKVIAKRLGRLQKCLTAVDDALTSREIDAPRLKQHDEQLRDYKRELSDVNAMLFSLDIEDTDELVTQHAKLEQALFDSSVRIKEMSKVHTPAPSTSSPSAAEAMGVKLPKLDVPTFNGSLLNWRNFWEQFAISVHDRSNLSNSEKLVYLQQALKGGSAKSSIEGLSRTGDNYEEAVQCLKARYDRPRLIHQAHVKTILDTPPLKEGTGKEIRKLHDTVLQHLRALKAMGYEPSGPFITSALELKLDQGTMFEWQKHSQKSEGVPHYQDLLDFLNLRAQATESTIADSSSKRLKDDAPYVKRGFSAGRTVASHATNTDLPSGQCFLCKPDKHPLYACPRFKEMPHEAKIATVRSNGLCMNCFASNHFVKQCKSVHRCKRCQRPHHTLLHVDSTPVNSTPASVTSQTINPAAPPFTPQSMAITNASQIEPQNGVVSSNTAIQLKSSSLLMTCRVLVRAPDGTFVEARALLDNASSASFVSERLAQTLRLPRANQKARISGVAGLSHHSSNQSIAKFAIAPTRPPLREIDVTAIVVPKVTCDLPFSPVPLKKE